MSKVNFVSEFNMFMRYARDNSLSLRERMLWIALFYVANDRATYNEQTGDYDWPDGFIQVSNNELNLYCCLDKRSIVTLRNTLKQRGLIDFREGKKNKRSPAYQLNYLSVNVGYKIVPNPPTNHTTNDDTNHTTNDDTKDGTNLSPFSKYNINQDIEQSISLEEEEEDTSFFAYALDRHTVNHAYRSSFGTAPTNAELDAMARIINARGLSAVAEKAVEETARAAPANRLAYFTALCEDWERQYIRTPEDAADYLLLKTSGEQFYPDPAMLASERWKRRQERKERYTRQEEYA